MDDLQEKEEILATVRRSYAEIALGVQPSCCGGQGCCPTASGSLPEGADMGLSCGNPLAPAALKEGDVVLDLGSGGGFDAFQAGPLVGKSGRVIGVDMTPEMLHKARKGCIWYREHTDLDNVEFRLGEIEHLPVADSAIDVVISNCVLNLSPDKPQVWKEIFRVLRPGGRVSVSDIALLEPLSGRAAASVAALVGCVAGAVLLSETEGILTSCGFTGISLERRSGWIESVEASPGYAGLRQALPAGKALHDVVTSALITAQKPWPCTFPTPNPSQESV